MSDDEQPREPEYAYVGRCRTCGAALAYVKDMRHKRALTAEKVAQMISADVLVERVRVEVITIEKDDCGCLRGDALLPVQASF